MRGRVDRSRGLISDDRPPSLTTNLIQKFEFGLGIARIFGIKERTPSPTFGSEVTPVVKVDDLLMSASPPRHRVWGGDAFGPGAPGVNVRWHGIFGGDNSTDQSLKNGRLVVHEAYLSHNFAGPGPTQWQWYIGTPLPIAGLSSRFCHYSNPGFDSPAAGIKESAFSVTVNGESAHAPPVTGIILSLFPGVLYRFQGPWILNFNEVFAFQSGASSAAASMCVFHAEEWPAA